MTDNNDNKKPESDLQKGFNAQGVVSQYLVPAIAFTGKVSASLAKGAFSIGQSMAPGVMSAIAGAIYEPETDANPRKTFLGKQLPPKMRPIAKLAIGGSVAAYAFFNVGLIATAAAGVATFAAMRFGAEKVLIPAAIVYGSSLVAAPVFYGITLDHDQYYYVTSETEDLTKEGMFKNDVYRISSTPLKGATSFQHAYEIRQEIVEMSKKDKKFEAPAQYLEARSSLIFPMQWDPGDDFITKVEKGSICRSSKYHWDNSIWRNTPLRFLNQDWKVYKRIQGANCIPAADLKP